MSLQSIVFIIVIMAVIAFIGSRVNGPRVTTIETRRETEDQKSGEDA